MVISENVLKLAFKQTKAEEMVRSASTILFNALSKLDYPLVSLSNLTQTPQYGFTASASNVEVGPKFVRITDIQDGMINWETVPYCQCEQHEKYLLSANDILFARTGATTGKTFLVRQAPYAIFASYLIRLRPKESVRPDYLYSFFQSNAYWSQILEEKEGSAQPNVNGKKLLTIQVPVVDNETQLLISRFLEAVRSRQDGDEVQLPDLPTYLSNQGRIVARIEKLAARIDEARNLRRQAMEEVMILDSRIRGNIFNDLSAYVSVQSLDMLSTKITDGEHITPRRCEVGHYLLSARNIQNNCIDLKNVDRVDDEEFFRIRRRCDPSIGDVLISCSGSIGKIAIVDESDSYVMVRSVAMVRPDQSRISPEFLAQAMRSQFVKSQMIEKAKSTAQANLFLGKIKSLKIPVPKMPEQHRIVAYLDGLQTKLDALKRHQAETAAELDALMPSILDRAFRGEL